MNKQTHQNCKNMKHQTPNQQIPMCGKCEKGKIKREREKLKYLLTICQTPCASNSLAVLILMLTIFYALLRSLFLAPAKFRLSHSFLQRKLLFSQFEMSLKSKSFSIKYFSKFFLCLFVSRNSILLCSANKRKCLSSIH